MDEETYQLTSRVYTGHPPVEIESLTLDRFEGNWAYFNENGYKTTIAAFADMVTEGIIIL